MERRSRVELLAPAGSVAAMKAAYKAGADAVYIGGMQFGARAYADNLSEQELIDAIHYAHIRDRQLYLTVNTLLKEEELNKSLYPYLKPLYEAGLDAVIVQDLGVMQAIRGWFPDLTIHASTQMGITGPLTATELQNLGIKRVVLARELELSEVNSVHKAAPQLEIECFVHGALCYSYSGHCLFSSLAGGRSGNRGRCAQPCRMAYCAMDENGQKLKNQEDGFLLSPKELCSLELLPDIIEAGVYSLKIEGRMKKPEYTAGVCAIYRKYIDLYEQKGRAGYRVDPKDIQNLADLFQRVGFTDGYWKRHNAREMMTIQKPIFRAENEALNEAIREQYIRQELTVPITMSLTLVKGSSACLTIAKDDVMVTVEGPVVEVAKSKPLSEEQVKKQLCKLGGTGYEATDVQIWMEEDVFLPVSSLNELRRKGLTELEHQLRLLYARIAPDRSPAEKALQTNRDEVGGERESSKHPISVLITTPEQLKIVLREENLSCIYIESSLILQKESEVLNVLRTSATKRFLLAFPHMFRENQSEKLLALWTRTKAYFQGVLVRNIEGLFFANDQNIPWIETDAGMYTFQTTARTALRQFKVAKDTLPVELNSYELKARGLKNSTMIAYGRLPMMITANCIKKTTGGCDHKSEKLITIRDRKNNDLPVRTCCEYCYNIIYNVLPLSLHEYVPMYLEHAGEMPNLRLDFTIETAKEVQEVISFFQKTVDNAAPDKPVYPFTRGHMKRGVE